MTLSSVGAGRRENRPPPLGPYSSRTTIAAPVRDGDPRSVDVRWNGQPLFWSAMKAATQDRDEFQLMVSSFVDHDWMSSM